MQISSAAAKEIANYSLRSEWWIATFPGLAVLITVLAINLVGDGLNDALNPRARK